MQCHHKHCFVLDKNMVSITLVFIVVFLSVLYYYLKSTYFTLRGAIPGIPPHFLFGNLLHLAWISRKTGSMPHTVIYLKERFGDVYQVWIGAMRTVTINCLEDAQHVFSHRHIYDQGDLFTEKFRIINPHGIICLKGMSYAINLLSNCFVSDRKSVV